MLGQGIFTVAELMNYTRTTGTDHVRYVRGAEGKRIAAAQAEAVAALWNWMQDRGDIDSC